MTNRDALVTASCQTWLWPGPKASAAIARLESGERIVSLFFDPIQVAVLVPPFPDGGMVLARFYRQVARTCAQVAAELDPDGNAPRHARREQP
jgi:hypothetical protein